MLRTLRQRLLASHILPILLVLPVMGVLLFSSLEKRVLIPQMADNLLVNARLMAEISRSEFELWGDPILFESMLSRVHLGSDIRVMFLTPRGTLLYANDPALSPQLGSALSAPGLAQAQKGKEAAFTNYSLFKTGNVVVDIFEPVANVNGEVVGIVRLTYQLGSISSTFKEVRWLILLALGIGLLLSIIIGTWLAFSISRPVRQVTDTMYDIALGRSREPVKEQGPAELRSQARAVNHLVEQLHLLETSRRQLLANLVHELGRPLGALRSAIHAISKGAAQNPVLFNELTDGMDEETTRLQHLLEEVSGLYDRSIGPLELNVQPVEISSWLHGVLIPWEAAAREKGIAWEADLTGELPAVRLDPLRMSQVIGNLLSNAIKYTPAGGKITITAGSDPGFWWFKVSDTGAGIRADEQEQIFKPFFRGDTGRRIKQGMGLGLTIARDLVAAHGGEIHVESTPSTGSTFTVKIPL